MDIVPRILFALAFLNGVRGAFTYHKLPARPVGRLAPGMRVLDVGCGGGDVASARTFNSASNFTRFISTPDSLLQLCVWILSLGAAKTSLLPTIEKLNLATAAELDLPTLEQRLRLEVSSSKGVILCPALVGAWSRKSP